MLKNIIFKFLDICALIIITYLIEKNSDIPLTMNLSDEGNMEYLIIICSLSYISGYISKSN